MYNYNFYIVIMDNCNITDLYKISVTISISHGYACNRIQGK